jgi:hypothetical protein
MGMADSVNINEDLINDAHSISLSEEVQPGWNKDFLFGALLLMVAVVIEAFSGGISMGLSVLFLGVYWGYLVSEYFQNPPPIPYEISLNNEPAAPQSDPRLDALVGATQTNTEALKFIVDYIQASIAAQQNP